MRDARAVVAGSVVVAECPGLTNDHTGLPVPFRLRRREADGAWLYEVGAPSREVPLLAGVASEAELRELVRCVRHTMAVGWGDSDCLLFRDGGTEVTLFVGFAPEREPESEPESEPEREPEPYLRLEAFFDLSPARVGTSPDGEPLYANPFGWNHVELGGVAPGDRDALTGFADAVLAALGD